MTVKSYALLDISTCLGRSDDSTTWCLKSAFSSSSDKMDWSRNPKVFKFSATRLLLMDQLFFKLHTMIVDTNMNNRPVFDFSISGHVS